MTSEKKIAANRINGRKSRGPKTSAGKSRASRNAQRHGLAAIGYGNPVYAQEIKQIARRICGDSCGDDDNPASFAQALVIAECDLVLRCVRAECIAVIERLRDTKSRALAFGDNSLELAKARALESMRAETELVEIKARLATRGEEQLNPMAEQTRAPADCAEERDDFEALREAMPDLDRLTRYERRARSRRNRAIRDFIVIRSLKPINERPMDIAAIVGPHLG